MIRQFSVLTLGLAVALAPHSVFAWLTYASMAVLVAGWAIAIADPALGGVGRYARRWVSEATFLNWTTTC